MDDLSPSPASPPDSPVLPAGPSMKPILEPPPAPSSEPGLPQGQSTADMPQNSPQDWGVGSPPEPSPQAAAGGETLVIPPTEAPNNPFIPQETVPAAGPAAPAKKSFGKRILSFLMILIVLALLAGGGYFLYGKFFTPAAKGATLIYWGLWETSAVTQGVIADFQTANPNIKVEYVKQSPRQYRERLQAAIARGDGPDVFEFHNTWVPMFRNELMAAPPEIITPAEFSTTFYPVASADLVGGSSVYGMPMMFDGLALYYNTDLLSAAGVNPPTTWPEVLEVVPKLTVKTDTQIQKSAIALGTTGNIEHFSDIIALMMMQDGARLTSPTGKEAEETLLFYRKFSNPSDPVYTWNDAMDNSVYAFATGKVAMILAPSWRVFDIKQINPSLAFRIGPVPQLPGNTVNWASYWVEGVSTRSKNPSAAWTFVKYLTSSDSVTKLYGEESKIRLFGEPYARVDLGSTLAEDPYVGAYIKGAPTAKSFPLASRTFDNGLNDKLIQYLTDAVNAVGGGTAPQQALETMSQGFAQVLGDYGLSVGAAPATTP